TCWIWARSSTRTSRTASAGISSAPPSSPSSAGCSCRTPGRNWRREPRGFRESGLDRLELLPDLAERLDREVEVRPLVRRGHLAAQASLPLRHDREAEPRDVDALREQRLSHRERL